MKFMKSFVFRLLVAKYDEAHPEREREWRDVLGDYAESINGRRSESRNRAMGIGTWNDIFVAAATEKKLSWVAEVLQRFGLFNQQKLLHPEKFFPLSEAIDDGDVCILMAAREAAHMLMEDGTIINDLRTVRAFLEVECQFGVMVAGKGWTGLPNTKFRGDSRPAQPIVDMVNHAKLDVRNTLLTGPDVLMMAVVSATEALVTSVPAGAAAAWQKGEFLITAFKFLSGIDLESKVDASELLTILATVVENGLFLGVAPVVSLMRFGDVGAWKDTSRSIGELAQILQVAASAAELILKFDESIEEGGSGVIAAAGFVLLKQPSTGGNTIGDWIKNGEVVGRMDVALVGRGLFATDHNEHLLAVPVPEPGDVVVLSGDPKVNRVGLAKDKVEMIWEQAFDAYAKENDVERALEYRNFITAMRDGMVEKTREQLFTAKMLGTLERIRIIYDVIRFKIIQSKDGQCEYPGLELLSLSYPERTAQKVRNFLLDFFGVRNGQHGLARLEEARFLVDAGCRSMSRWVELTKQYADNTVRPFLLVFDDGKEPREVECEDKKAVVKLVKIRLKPNRPEYDLKYVNMWARTGQFLPGGLESITRLMDVQQDISPTAVSWLLDVCPCSSCNTQTTVATDEPRPMTAATPAPENVPAPIVTGTGASDVVSRIRRPRRPQESTLAKEKGAPGPKKRRRQPFGDSSNLPDILSNVSTNGTDGLLPAPQPVPMVIDASSRASRPRLPRTCKNNPTNENDAPRLQTKRRAQ